MSSGQKALIDFTDAELQIALRNSIEYVQYSPANYREEIFRRSQNSNTKALNRWTLVITLATVANATAALLLKSLGWL